MDKKPSYEELDKKNKKLERLTKTQEKNEISLLKEISELKRTKKYYDSLMQNTEDYVVICECSVGDCQLSGVTSPGFA
jgi:hypothetical protein